MMTKKYWPSKILWGVFLFAAMLLILAIADPSTEEKENKGIVLDSVAAKTAVATISPTAIKNRKPLYSSKDAGKTWQNASGNLPDSIQVSFLEPIGKELLMATDNRGLFLSGNNRSIWQQIGKGLPNPKINALHLAGQDIFVGVYRAGIYTKKAYGGTWQSLNFDLSDVKVQSIVTLGTTLYAGTDSGIFKLNQNKWEALFTGVQVLNLDTSKGKLIAGTSQGTLLSVDRGKHWKWIHKEGAIHYSLFVNGKIIEMYLSGDIFISSDDGNFWKEAIYAPRSRSYTYDVVEVSGHMVLSNNYGIHRNSKQNGAWEHIFFTEELAFFDLLVVDDVLYGGTRYWDEFRGRN